MKASTNGKFCSNVTLGLSSVILTTLTFSFSCKLSNFVNTIAS